MELKSVLIVALCAVALVTMAEALTCYQGMTGNVQEVPCPIGSCANGTEAGVWYYACYQIHEDDGCQTIQGHNVCFCNTDLCNKAGGVSFESILISIVKNTYRPGNKLTVV